MKNKGYALIELLAVVVVIILILYFTLPKMFGSKETNELKEQVNEEVINTPSNTNDGVITSSKIAAVKESAIIILNMASTYYQTESLLNDNIGNVKCEDITTTDNNFKTCYIKFDSNGVPTINVEGSDTGKFKNIKCNGTKSNLKCEKVSN